jgi:hypothetical protein
MTTQPGRGKLFYYDGPTGDVIDILDHPSGTNIGFGLSIAHCGDVNGNGSPDILARYPGSNNFVRCIDGGSRDAIFDVVYSHSFASEGHDWNEDDFPDFLITLYDGSNRVTLYSGAPAGVEVLGQPCGSYRGASPRIGATGVARVGSQYPIHLSDVAPGRSAVLLVGNVDRAAGPPLGLLGPGCLIRVTPNALFPATTSQIGPDRGAATVELAIPPNASLEGIRFEAQWVVLDTSGDPVALTRTLRVTITGPP